MNRFRKWPLSRTQKLVLQLLAEGPKSAQRLEYDWPGLTEAMARSAALHLADRGLVDLTGWDESTHRTYDLTEKGRIAERELLEDAP